jgi:tyrosine-protein kinase Etk/Wzc
VGKASNSLTSGIDFKRVLIKYSKNWYLFLIALILAIAFASVKNRNVIPIYRLSTSVLIEDKSNKSVLDQRASISADPLFLNSKLIENQISILKSFSQLRKIIEDLDFQVSYYARGKYIWEEIYKRSPFVVKFDTNHKQIKSEQFDLKFTGIDKFQIWTENPELLREPKTYHFGDTITGKGYSFSVLLKDSIRPPEYFEQVYGFVINDIDQLTSQYRNKTDISPEKETSVINISSTGPNKEKEKDYLNELTRMFLKSNLEKKNKIQTSTIEFINSQLHQIQEVE